MKIGYLLSGNPQTYNQCIETFNTNLNDIIDGVYSHIWWDESHQNKCYKMHFREKLEDYNLSSYLIENFDVKKYLIEDGKHFDITFFRRFTKDTWGDQSDEFYKIMTPIILYGLLSQTYSINQAYSLSLEYEYDVIIKSRPDLIFTKDLRGIISNLDLSGNNIYFQSSVDGGHLYSGEYPNRPCDWFFIANQKTMGKFLNGWHQSISEKFTNGIMHTSDLVKYVSETNNITPILVDFGAHIYKNATDHYYKYHNKVEMYLNDFNFDLYEPNNPNIWPYWIDQVDFNHFRNIKF